jgi:hypothetical protein
MTAAAAAAAATTAATAAFELGHASSSNRRARAHLAQYSNCVETAGEQQGQD